MERWTLIFNDFNPQKEKVQETLCTLGNGYFATRGAAEEANTGEFHYPGTYLAGGYNRLISETHGKKIEHEDLVNWPNWLCLTFRHEDEEAWFDLNEVEIIDYKKELHLKSGMLERKISFKDNKGRKSLLWIRRIVHMGDPHLAAIQWTITPVNWEGKIFIRSGIDGDVSNQGVKGYGGLNGRHLETLEKDISGKEGIFLLVQTSQSRLRMALAARTQIFKDNLSVLPVKTVYETDNFIAEDFLVECEKGKVLDVEKIIAVYTCRDFAISEERHEACKAIARAGRFVDLYQTHVRAWDKLWWRCDIELEGNDEAQLILRAHIFHLMQTASMNTVDLDVGIPPKGWHGEAYRGHIFWDDLFIFPFINLRIPELTRELLMYRYRRLPEARHIAFSQGYKGARFPWQSGSNGREETPRMHLHLEKSTWYDDFSWMQLHINVAIAYNIWQYYEISHDRQFLSFYGAELILETARFMADYALYNPERDRYEIHRTVGPDEYHSRYPGADEPGINNNAYTNIMTAWLLKHALKALDLLSPYRREELLADLDIKKTELDTWEEMRKKMYVPFLSTEIINQFEGYENLSEFDCKGFIEEHGDVYKIDAVLRNMGDTTDNYKVSKQADVLMLFYLFSSEGLKELMNDLGYDFDPANIPANVNYYLKRTAHGSSLSRHIHSWVLARSHRKRSWHLFSEALLNDFDDRKGSTAEGIHLGGMAGTLDMMQRCFTGVEIRDDVLWFNPVLPEELKSVRMRIRYRARWINIYLSQDVLRLSQDEGKEGEVMVGFKGNTHYLAPSREIEFRLKEMPEEAKNRQ